jgi:hypothetical protein
MSKTKMQMSDAPRTEIDKLYEFEADEGMLVLVRTQDNHIAFYSMGDPEKGPAAIVSPMQLRAIEIKIHEMSWDIEESLFGDMYRMVEALEEDEEDDAEEQDTE